VNPVSESVLLRKSGRAGNRTRTSGSVARNSDSRSQRITEKGLAAREKERKEERNKEGRLQEER
jgi:hypothetical protein